MATDFGDDVRSFVLTDGAIGETLEDVDQSIVLHGNYTRLGFEVNNLNDAGGNRLDNLVLLIKVHENGSWHEYVAASEWGDENGPPYVRFCTGAIDVLAPNSSGAAIVDFCGPVYAMKFAAKAEEGGSVAMTIRGILWR